MTVKLKSLLCAAMSCMLCVLQSPMAAFAGSVYEVKISINVETDTKTPVVPRSAVPFKLDVNNLKGRSWIRVHTDTSSSGINDSFNNDCINIADGWILRGEYFYYTQKAEAASSVTAIESFDVPDISVSDNATLTVAVRAEAIDERAVTPDFTLEDPWKGKTPDSIASYISSSGGSNRNRTLSSDSSGSSAGMVRYEAPTAQAVLSYGSWYCKDSSKGLWKFGSESTGSYARDGWYYIKNSYAPGGERAQWFKFDTSEYMQTGWDMKDSISWYHLHEKSDGNLGAMDTGWYTDTQDSRKYYLDNTLGVMKSGWQEIGGKKYYFARLEDIPGPTWVHRIMNGTAIGRWIYSTLNARSYGSMYMDETTPDGSRVGSDGARQK